MMRAIDVGLLARLRREAESSQRRRQHYNLHRSYREPCQRLLNVLMRDSYIRPHRHASDSKQETLLAVSGRLGVVRFLGNGEIAHTVIIAAGLENVQPALAVEIDPACWHTVVALDDGAALFEMKAGPFDPAAAKEPAAWAPAEHSAEAPAYLEMLRRRIANDARELRRLSTAWTDAANTSRARARPSRGRFS